LATGHKSLSQRIIHSILERDLPKNFSCKTILDIGGGEGEHANYVKHEHDNYLVLDKRKIQDKADINIEFIIGDAEEIPIHDESVDRVVITCLLHHVEDPQKVLAEMWRSIKLGGIATILLPHDPGFCTEHFKL
jgi:ubiquinone/menaquinone biosynthesis C-methylase UbiE